MNKSRQKGDRFERRVLNRLISNSVYTIRQAGSKFPDIIAIIPNKVYFLECKTNKYISKEERIKFEELKELGTCLIVYNEKGKIQVCGLDYQESQETFIKEKLS